MLKKDALKRNVPKRPAKKTMVKNLFVNKLSNTHSSAAAEIRSAAVFKPKGVDKNNSEIRESKKTKTILFCLLKINSHMAEISIIFNRFRGKGNRFAAATCSVKIKRINTI